jgi:hypothetical protein
MSELPNNDPFAEIKPGMSFTGVIDGSFPGGYLITVGVGNCPTLSGVAFTSDQPAPIERNVNENVPIFPPRMDINIDEVPPGFEMEHELVSKYYNIGKFVPVKLNPVNPSTRVPINQLLILLIKGNVSLKNIMVIQKTLESRETLFYLDIFHLQHLLIFLLLI